MQVQLNVNKKQKYPPDLTIAETHRAGGLLGDGAQCVGRDPGEEPPRREPPPLHRHHRHTPGKLIKTLTKGDRLSMHSARVSNQ